MPPMQCTLNTSSIVVAQRILDRRAEQQTPAGNAENDGTHRTGKAPPGHATRPDGTRS
jgi:hypothetical protein